MNKEIEKVYRAAILTIPGIGSQRLRQLLALFGTAIHAWEAAIESFSVLENTAWLNSFLSNREKINIDKVRSNIEKQQISLAMLGEDHYPSLLAECPDAPPVLFYKGYLTTKQEGLAVVGARRATAYGKAAAHYIAKAVVESNYVLVSGLARGIDSAAHKGALEAGGITWAFLAGGLDQIYPSENARLAMSIIENKGALFSEYPPGMPVEPGHFPARNRLISGSSRGVIVVEAALKSGSLITVDFALEQGREVFAVPGPIFSEQSKGTHQLLRMGAKLVADKEDILSELPKKITEYHINEYHINEYHIDDCNLFSDIEKKVVSNNDVDIEWIKILDCLSDIPLHIDRLTTLCNIPAQEIALGLLELQLAGKIIQLPGQNYVLNRKTYSSK